MLRLVGGLVVAVTCVAVMVVPEVWGIATWKWVLAMAGLGTYVVLGRDPKKAS